MEAIDAGRHQSVPASKIAMDYWRLGGDARLGDVVLAVRRDGTKYRNVNHALTGAMK